MGFAAILAGASLLFSGAGAIMEGQAQSASADYNAQVARNNQVIAQQNAQIALQQGDAAEQAQRQKTAQTIGAELAQEAASGVEPNSGSPLNVRASEAETGELNALTTRYNYGLQARNDLTQASSYGAQAGLYGAQADWALPASILGGASSVSSKWAMYQQNGIFGSLFNSNQPKGQLAGGNADSPFAFAG
jgi:hypothetical protein